MTRRALVTGAGGFVGQKLCAYLTQQGWEVRGADARTPQDPATCIQCDVSDFDQAQRAVTWAGPVTHVFHLAAVTFVPDAIQHPAATMAVNACGTIHLLHALRDHAPDARFLFVGSAEVYGPPQELPVTEKHPLDPQNPYAIAKAAADQYCRFVHRSTEMAIIRARPFNHSGVGQSDRFVLSSFARQVAQAEGDEGTGVVRVGDLAAARDFLHVDDVVRAYEVLALKGTAGEAYNICSGQSQQVEDALKALIGLSSRDIAVESDPSRLRPVEVPVVQGSHEKLTADTGWRPEIPFDQVLADLLSYWREKEQEQIS